MKYSSFCSLLTDVSSHTKGGLTLEVGMETPSMDLLATQSAMDLMTAHSAMDLLTTQSAMDLLTTQSAMDLLTAQ